MKLNALTDARHSDEEIERRLAEIDENIRKAKDIFVQQSHLPGPAPSVTAVTRLPAYTGVNRHASGIRIELMDSMVPEEAMMSGVTHPRRGCLSVETDVHVRFQIPGRDSYSTGYQNIVAPVVQPLTGLCGMPHRQRLQTGNP